MTVKEEEELRFLKVDNRLIRTVYQHVSFLANFRFRSSIEYLQNKNKGYEIEDFVQEILEKVSKILTVKKFPTINHLKKFISIIMQYHYLSQKRKYYQTKQRGTYLEESLDSLIDDTRNLLDTLYNDKEYQTYLDNLQFNFILKKNLFIVLHNDLVNICTLDEIKNNHEGIVISLTLFLLKHYELGKKSEVCKYFKSKGIYISKKSFDLIVNSALDYCINNSLL